ncbi:J domain-containing protein [Nitrospirillum viridazoti]|uniref:Molecular chaperone DnaJ n=1 Tax=Nitrospirillum viridazoti CBAmc TaxID=1441467 RepID=A0A248JLP2_9PROT|nr:DnaJ domain-containing protein [Nitrospirillum amazonense]ASG19579.1 molecular chaperone DnaJ [Nitrospirillum amazonense CBAmc]TWB26596.1 DnaJ-like protein [Nitrospirillum amazonense]
MQKQRPGFSFSFDDPPQVQVRACDHPGCAEVGEYRAPKNRSQLNDYYWFCLDHVRAYNKAWDYYQGMSTEEIERAMRYDTTWQRPTWPMGDWRTRERNLRDSMSRGHSFGADWEAGTSHRPPPPSPRTPEDDALDVLGLKAPIGFAEVKQRYRELAKQNHPDIHGGDKDAEERLKRINQAYNVLKAAYADHG